MVTATCLRGEYCVVKTSGARENDEFRIVDIGSLNGTYVTHEPVASAVLANGDEIQIGKFRLVFLTRPTTS
jgi:pSer/pThr/pTyr-binding forkhead associated (FHA) protein